MTQNTYNPVPLNIPFQPMGMPIGIQHGGIVQVNKPNFVPPPLKLPGQDLPKGTFFLADYGGCGAYRMIFPALLLNLNQKAVINELTIMHFDPRFYADTKCVRLQRQATPHQANFVKFLKSISKQVGFKLIYEVDDIIFKEDIPLFNRCRTAFEHDEITKSSIEMMLMSDEMSVTCQFMKDYYIEKTGNKNITVIPNYLAKCWFDGLYDKNKIEKNYHENKRRPRILYCGSGTHIDVSNKTNQIDDFTHIVNTIIKTRKDFRWIFQGCFPLPIKPFIDNGEIEYRDWKQLLYYPKSIRDARPNLMIAPLQENIFNMAKSEIKFLESAAIGIPCICQNMVTYENAFLKFKTGDELIDNIKEVMKNENLYFKISKKSREYAETKWLDDHLDEYMELCFTPFGSSSRKKLK